jgi:hypothetical protein
MTVPENASKKAKPVPAEPRKGMTPEEQELFEKSFKRNEEALRRLAKL